MMWFVKSFKELTTDELYAILQLRIDVFVVEQNCIYSDIDGKDNLPGALHLFSVKDDQIACYLRIFPPGISYPEMPSLGRVITHPDFRGTGIGHELLQRALQIIDKRWPDKTCHISAQSYLEKFYQQHGFSTVGEGYLEDDIPHIGMERVASK
ncbi:GNAT family N-acetyltransferase [Aliikangiella coralliicola]|uniref:GNAT family N-acetyltransferase n=1 Tax=Aliikangiella coralliicola TaxID=2592383 RepID=A0A545U6I2_9GAMM|nr:GNAT family N-acetyltransferase [Aliikangiella coralliicola]TQV85076.1 GNAT family N-acetyltransferase [Aliikangiella coralliicola]